MRSPFTHLRARVAPLYEPNIDTDIIIPSREMKRVSKTGLGEGLFANRRYSDPAKRIANPDFILNQSPFNEAKILAVGTNFGCGSSREHAVWALLDWGIRAIIAPSFARIFYANCIRNGILPLSIKADPLAAWCAAMHQEPALAHAEIDLPARRLATPAFTADGFAIADSDADMLIKGQDLIDLTLDHRPAIDDFWAADRTARPWLYETGTDA